MGGEGVDLGVEGVEGGSMGGDDEVFKDRKSNLCKVKVTSPLLSRTADGGPWMRLHSQALCGYTYSD